MLADMRFVYSLFIQPTNLHFNGFCSNSIENETKAVLRIYVHIEYMANMAAGAGENTKATVICRLIYDVNVFVSYLDQELRVTEPQWMNGCMNVVSCVGEKYFLSVHANGKSLSLTLSLSFSISHSVSLFSSAIYLVRSLLKRYEVQYRLQLCMRIGNGISHFQYSTWTDKTEFRNAQVEWGVSVSTFKVMRETVCKQQNIIIKAITNIIKSKNLFPNDRDWCFYCY